jgi:hypothetical protein
MKGNGQQMSTPRRRREEREPLHQIVGTPHLAPTEDEIARRAYQLFEARGGEHGRDREDWFQAERELRQLPVGDVIGHGWLAGEGATPSEPVPLPRSA